MVPTEDKDLKERIDEELPILRRGIVDTWQNFRDNYGVKYSHEQFGRKICKQKGRDEIIFLKLLGEERRTAEPMPDDKLEVYIVSKIY